MVETDIRLSIIIPIYNGEKYLDRLGASIRKFSTGQVEILLIDDGSLDKSLEKCRKFVEIWPFVKVFSKENGGIADTRNYGMKQARGTYLCFMDQDDEIVMEICMKALEKAEKTQADACLWSSERAFENGTKAKNVTFQQERLYDETEIRGALLAQYLRKEPSEKIFHIPGYVWSGLYRNEFLRNHEIHFFSFVDYEDDCIFMNQVMRWAKKLMILPDVGYYWTCNLQSESHRIKYIDHLWEKKMRLREWFQNSVYDIFEAQKPPREQLEKENAIWIYEYIENICSIKNPASNRAIIREMRVFFQNKEHFAWILQEKEPYGGAGGRRKMMHSLLVKKWYPAVLVWLRLYEKISITRKG